MSPAKTPQQSAPRMLSTPAIFAEDHSGLILAINPEGLHFHQVRMSVILLTSSLPTVAFNSGFGRTGGSFSLALSTVALEFQDTRFCPSARVVRSCKKSLRSDSNAAAEA